MGHASAKVCDASHGVEGVCGLEVLVALGSVDGGESCDTCLLSDGGEVFLYGADFAASSAGHAGVGDVGCLVPEVFVADVLEQIDTLSVGYAEVAVDGTSVDADATSRAGTESEECVTA